MADDEARAQGRAAAAGADAAAGVVELNDGSDGITERDLRRTMAWLEGEGLQPGKAVREPGVYRCDVCKRPFG